VRAIEIESSKFGSSATSQAAGPSDPRAIVADVAADVRQSMSGLVVKMYGAFLASTQAVITVGLFLAAQHP
jgi:hypothetical protein